MDNVALISTWMGIAGILIAVGAAYGTLTTKNTAIEARIDQEVKPEIAALKIEMKDHAETSKALIEIRSDVRHLTESVDRLLKSGGHG